jgi:hypothetical protein
MTLWLMSALHPELDQISWSSGSIMAGPANQLGIKMKKLHCLTCVPKHLFIFQIDA